MSNKKSELEPVLEGHEEMKERVYDATSDRTEGESRAPRWVSHDNERKEPRLVARKHADEQSSEAKAGSSSLLKRPSSSSSRCSLKPAPTQGSVSRQQLCRRRGKGRARLPEKLMEYMNAQVAPGVLWWLPGEESFALDSSRIQEEVLDVYFRGTKLPSFVRSLNRWGFRRIGLSSLPKSALCFHQRLFRKSEPHLVSQMQLQMTKYTPKPSQEEEPQAFDSPPYRPRSSSVAELQSVQPKQNNAQVHVQANSSIDSSWSDQQLPLQSLLLNRISILPSRQPSLWHTGRQKEAPPDVRPQQLGSLGPPLAPLAPPQQRDTSPNQAAALAHAAASPQSWSQPDSNQGVVHAELLPLLQQLLTQETRINEDIATNLVMPSLISGLQQQQQQPPPQHQNPPSSFLQLLAVVQSLFPAEPPPPPQDIPLQYAVLQTENVGVARSTQQDIQQALLSLIMELPGAQSPSLAQLPQPPWPPPQATAAQIRHILPQQQNSLQSTPQPQPQPQQHQPLQLGNPEASFPWSFFDPTQRRHSS